MSTITDKLTELKTGLQRKDPTFCGSAPSWVIEMVQQNLVTFIAESPDNNQQIKDFVIGAIRFVADQMSDCDVLLGRLGEMIKAAEESG